MQACGRDQLAAAQIFSQRLAEDAIPTLHCIHIEWDITAPVTPLGQLPFFIEYLKQGGLFDGWVADCPLSFTSPNAPRKRDVLGTLLLSVLAGHRRYAHVTALRCDAVNPPLLGMSKVISEDALRRALVKPDAGYVSNGGAPAFRSPSRRSGLVNSALWSRPSERVACVAPVAVAKIARLDA